MATYNNLHNLFLNYILKNSLADTEPSNSIIDIINKFNIPDISVLDKNLLLHLIVDDENIYLNKHNKNNTYNSFGFTPLYNFFKLFLLENYDMIYKLILSYNNESDSEMNKKPKYDLNCKIEDTKKDLDVIYNFWEESNILPLMNSYSGMGYTDVIFYDILCQKLFICKMGGSNGFDVDNNIKMLEKYCKNNLEKRELLLHSNYVEEPENLKFGSSSFNVKSSYVDIYKKYILGDTYTEGYKKYYGEIDLHNKHLNFTNYV